MTGPSQGRPPTWAERLWWLTVAVGVLALARAGYIVWQQEPGWWWDAVARVALAASSVLIGVTVHHLAADVERTGELAARG